jgi:hypothetical protein
MKLKSYRNGCVSPQSVTPVPEETPDLVTHHRRRKAKSLLVPLGPLDFGIEQLAAQRREFTVTFDRAQ